jgi:Zn-dependent protease
MPANAAQFRLFGFPVQVRAGFLVFVALVVVLQGPEFGVPFAAFTVVYTLLHELGHAVAARSTGAEARISLDFMAGYASFVPSRRLTTWEHIGISFAGPGVQVLVGSVVYVLVRGGLHWPDSGHPLHHAAFWAGPVVGLLNLVPIIPFDGGAIAESLLGVVSPRGARTVMEVFSLLVSGVAVVLLALDPRLSGLAVFAAIPLLSVLASISARRNQARREVTRTTLSRAEALAWAGGPIDFPAGTVPSPWFRAWQQLQASDTAAARHVLLLDLADTEPVNWWAPDAAPLEALRLVCELLPDPLPHGRAYSSHALAGVLLRLGQFDRAGRYAAEAFQRHGEPPLALRVADAAEALGQHDTAEQWRKAAQSAALRLDT